MTDRHIQTWLQAGEWIESGASPIEALTGFALVCLTTDCPACLSTYARVVQVRAADEWEEHGRWWTNELCYQLSNHTATGYVFDQDMDTMVGGAYGVYAYDDDDLKRDVEAIQIHNNDRPYHADAPEGYTA